MITHRGCKRYDHASGLCTRTKQPVPPRGKPCGMYRRGRLRAKPNNPSGYNGDKTPVFADSLSPCLGCNENYRYKVCKGDTNRRWFCDTCRKRNQQESEERYEVHLC